MTSLKIILLSKFNKRKRQARIEQMERELELLPSVTIHNEYKPQVQLYKYNLYKKEREEAYMEIEDLLPGYYFTDAGTAKDIHCKYRRYDGTLFLHWSQNEIDLLNCSFQFINECKERLESAGFIVNVLDMERIKFLCPEIKFN